MSSTVHRTPWASFREAIRSPLLDKGNLHTFWPRSVLKNTPSPTLRLKKKQRVKALHMRCNRDIWEALGKTQRSSAMASSLMDM
jgi:hypothetical protein